MCPLHSQECDETVEQVTAIKTCSLLSYVFHAQPPPTPLLYYSQPPPMLQQKPVSQNATNAVSTACSRYG